MGDLQVSAAVLDELRGTLRSMAGQLDGACRELRSVDAGAMGAAPLVQEVGDFASGWHYGITQVGEHATQAAGMLDHIGKAFDDLERKLTSALLGGKGGKR